MAIRLMLGLRFLWCPGSCRCRYRCCFPRSTNRSIRLATHLCHTHCRPTFVACRNPRRPRHIPRFHTLSRILCRQPNSKHTRTNNKMFVCVGGCCCCGCPCLWTRTWCFHSRSNPTNISNCCRLNHIVYHRSMRRNTPRCIWARPRTNILFGRWTENENLRAKWGLPT